MSFHLEEAEDESDIPSHRAQIEALDIGETFSRAARFDPDIVTKDVPPQVLRGIRMSLQSSVFKVQRRTGARYTIECGEFRTASRDIVVCAAVTRMN